MPDRHEGRPRQPEPAGQAGGWVERVTEGGDGAGGAGHEHGREAQAQRDELQTRIDAQSQPSADGLTPEGKRAQAVAQERQRVAQLKRLQTALGMLQGDMAFSARLRALAQEGLPGVWLTGIEFSDAGFRLEGRALEAASIPDYLAMLSRRPALKDLPLSGFSIVPPETAGASQTVEPGVAFAVNPEVEAP